MLVGRPEDLPEVQTSSQERGLEQGDLPYARSHGERSGEVTGHFGRSSTQFESGEGQRTRLLDRVNRDPA